MKLRYLLCPGPVQSRTDGDLHHITARQLAFLYGVPMAECVTLPEPAPSGGACYPSNSLRRDLLASVKRGELIALCPRYDGDYRAAIASVEGGLR